MSMSWLGIFRPLGIVTRHLFRKPTTVMYPRQQRAPTERFRGGTFALTVDPQTGEDNCIGCRLCEAICPSRIITVTLERRNNRGYPGVFTLNFEACMQCELCVQVCPTDAIVMTRELNGSALTRADLFMSKEKLMDNGKKLAQVWATGDKLQLMHGKPPPKAKGAATE